MKSQIVWYFSDEYTLEFLGYDPFCSENVLFFFSFMEVFCIYLYL